MIVRIMPPMNISSAGISGFVRNSASRLAYTEPSAHENEPTSIMIVGTNGTPAPGTPASAPIPMVPSANPTAEPAVMPVRETTAAIMTIQIGTVATTIAAMPDCTVVSA